MVMRYFPNVLSRQESDASADRNAVHLLEHGFTKWAVELIGIESFIGFIGL
jgi:[ribosomal protein S5]-alanine N-acetyltransferase